MDENRQAWRADESRTRTTASVRLVDFFASIRATSDLHPAALEE